MKKVLLSLIAVLCLLLALPVSAENEKVPVYVFSKDGCPACVAAQEYFDELEESYPELFEVIEIVTFGPKWEMVSEDRQELLISIYEHFEQDTAKIATPSIIIGEYFTQGLPGDTDEIYNEIMKVKNSKNKVDVVKKIVEENKYNLEDMQKYDPSIFLEVDEESETGKYDTIIIIGIFAVLIGGFVGLIMVGKK